MIHKPTVVLFGIVGLSYFLNVGVSIRDGMDLIPALITTAIVLLITLVILSVFFYYLFIFI